MSQLFYYKLIFLTELLIAEFLFAFRLKKRKHFVIRLLIGLFVCYAVTFFFPLASYSGWYSSLLFLSIFALTLFCVFFNCYNAPPVTCFFLAITAYTVQHLSYEIYLLISDLMDANFNLYGSAVIDFSNISNLVIFLILIYLEIHVAVYYLSYLIIGKRLYRNGEIKIQNKSILLLAVLILLVDIVINAFVVYIDHNVNSLYGVIICIYNILCCILVFYIQLSLLNTKKMEIEIKTTKQLLTQARKQYETSRENINSINMKCHNLKYEVRKMGQKSEWNEQSIKEIENMIAIYDTNVKTGNEAIDIILNEKSLLCLNRGIMLTCMADCKNLSFIRESDLYVLFGNALDNAIEAVSKITDAKKKFIHVQVYPHENLISISVQNYYEGSISLDENGLPITTKEEKDYHGFGMKSIQFIAEKYQGDVSIVLKDSIFHLNIILPIQK